MLDFTAFENLQYRWIFEDSIFLQTALLTTSAFVDLQAGLPLQLTTVTRLRKTLRLLNQRLAEEDGYERDVTILIIVILTTVAVIFNDSVAVKAHLNGLDQIVQLRSASPINPKLLLKLDQYVSPSVPLPRRLETWTMEANVVQIGIAIRSHNRLHTTLSESITSSFST